MPSFKPISSSYVRTHHLTYKKPFPLPQLPPIVFNPGTDNLIYFIKDKFYWIYSNKEEEVVDGPLEVSSQWTKCEGRQRIIPHKREKVYHKNSSANHRHVSLYVTLTGYFLLSYSVSGILSDE